MLHEYPKELDEKGIQGHIGRMKRERNAERGSNQRDEASLESNANDPLLGEKRNSVLGSGAGHGRRDASSAAANGRSARLLANPE